MKNIIEILISIISLILLLIIALMDKFRYPRKYAGGAKRPNGNKKIPNILLTSQQRDIISTFQNILKNKMGLDNAIYQYRDIKPDLKLKYQTDSGIVNMNCHNGQRKLNNTEIQFYTRYATRPVNLGQSNNSTDSDQAQTIVVYVGSASGEHTPLILDLFPDIKILMIDPNYHNMSNDYLYVTQSLENISRENYDSFVEFLGAKGGSVQTFQSTYEVYKARMKKLQEGAQKLQNVKWLYSNDTSDAMAAARDYFENSSYNETVTKNNKLFYDNSDELFQRMLDSDERVFIIQDYATIELMKIIRSAVDKVSNINLLYISDLRTTSTDEMHGVHILWNNMLQNAIIHILRPNWSMLKFHPPYLDNKDLLKKVYNDLSDPEYIPTSDEYGFIISDMKKMQSVVDHGLSISETGAEYEYPRSSAIFVQSWPPRSSSEARLVICLSDIEKEPVRYSPSEWEDLFYYYKYFRMIWAEDEFIKALNANKIQHSYDGCADCYIEIRIISEYLLTHVMNRNINSDFFKLSNKEVHDIILKNMNKEFCSKLVAISNKITEATFYDINNPKCSAHGGRVITDKVNIYTVDKSQGLLSNINITPEDYYTKSKYIIKFDKSNENKILGITPKIQPENPNGLHVPWPQFKKYIRT